jgi:D-threonate/D-erythronate kinase
MALELLIIADDLTGAVDTAVQFSKNGVSAAVYLSARSDFKNSPAVAAVNTESRHLSKKEAYQRVKCVAEKALRAGCRRFYKKIDSTFRGNAGAELDALMTAAGVRRMALVPAYPSAGRTTKCGVQYVNGAPLHKTAFSRDPREPAAESFIPAILKKQTARPVRLAGAAAKDGRDGIIVYDAETGRDLRVIGAVLEKGGALNVAAGAAGFAEVVAGLYRGRKRKPLTFNRIRRTAGPLFIVNGSLNEVSLAQVEQARQDGVACLTPSQGAKPVDMADSIVRYLRNSGCAVLTTVASGRALKPSSRYAERLGRIAADVIKAVPDASAAVFGGDTASAVCRRMGCGTLYPRKEIMPGLTVCSAGGPSGSIVILKSGGFGPDNVIRTIRKYLKSG